MRMKKMAMSPLIALVASLSCMVQPAGAQSAGSSGSWQLGHIAPGC